MHALFFFSSPVHGIRFRLFFQSSFTTVHPQLLLSLFSSFLIFFSCVIYSITSVLLAVFLSFFFFSWLLWDFSLFFPRICYFPFLILLISTFILSLVSNNIIFPFIFSVFLCVCSFFVFVLFVLSFI